MADPLQPVTPGGKFPTSAATVNAWNETARRVLRRGVGPTGAAPAKRGDRPHLLVTVKNSTGADRARGDIGRIDGSAPVTLPTDDEYLAQAEPILTATSPGDSTDRIAIFAEPVPADEYGDAVIEGHAVCTIEVTDAAHEFAEPYEAGACTKLRTAATGPARIEWREGGSSGEKLAAVALGHWALPAAAGNLMHGSGYVIAGSIGSYPNFWEEDVAEFEIRKGEYWLVWGVVRGYYRCQLDRDASSGSSSDQHLNAMLGLEQSNPSAAVSVQMAGPYTQPAEGARPVPVHPVTFSAYASSPARGESDTDNFYWGARGEAPLVAALTSTADTVVTLSVHHWLAGNVLLSHVGTGEAIVTAFGARTQLVALRVAAADLAGDATFHGWTPPASPPPPPPASRYYCVVQYGPFEAEPTGPSGPPSDPFCTLYNAVAGAGDGFSAQEGGDWYWRVVQSGPYTAGCEGACDGPVVPCCAGAGQVFHPDEHPPLFLNMTGPVGGPVAGSWTDEETWTSNVAGFTSLKFAITCADDVWTIDKTNVVSMAVTAMVVDQGSVICEEGAFYIEFEDPDTSETGSIGT